MERRFEYSELKKQFTRLGRRATNWKFILAIHLWVWVLPDSLVGEFGETPMKNRKTLEGPSNEWTANSDFYDLFACPLFVFSVTVTSDWVHWLVLSGCMLWLYALVVHSVRLSQSLTVYSNERQEYRRN